MPWSTLMLPRFAFEQPAAAILLPVVLGTGVGYAMRPRKTQEKYLEIKQPPYRPAPVVFGPIWTVLYAAMGFAAHRAWTKGIISPDPRVVRLTKQGAMLYSIQLGLNLIWMPLFFRFGRPIEATIDIVSLTGLTGVLMYKWAQVDKLAGWALGPYLAWLSFATYLCAGAGYLNGWSFRHKVRGSAGEQSGASIGRSADKRE